MTKRQFSTCAVAVLMMIIGLSRINAEYNVGLTPEAEFVTLSDLAAVHPSGGGATAVEGGAAPAEAPALEAAPVVSPASEVAPVVGDSAASKAVPAVVEVLETGTVSGAVSGVLSNGPAETETVSVASFPALEKQNLISVALDDVPLQEVVKLFTKISGANIIASSTNLHGKVTVNLQEVEWKPALDSILDMHSLMVVEKTPGSAIYSVTAKGMADPMSINAIPLYHTQVSNVWAIIEKIKAPGVLVTPDPNANAIVVRGTVANINDIRQLIKEIDVTRQQVYIEAKFLELTDEAIKDLGVNWQVLEGYGVGVVGLSQTLSDERSKFNGARTGLGTVDSNLRPKGASGGGVPGSGATDSRSSSDTITTGSGSSFSDSTDGGLVSTVGSSGTRTTSDNISKTANYQRESERIAGQHISDIRTAVLNAADFKLVLSALQQVNGISVVSNPKIIVSNEEEAKINIGNMEPNIKGTVTPGQQGQANTTTYSLDEKDPYFNYGIELKVVPTIDNKGNNIRVNIVPKLSTFVKDKPAPDGNTYPIRAVKEIITSFILESGTTAAIGGLTKTEDYDVVKKVPLLGDIPLIGKYLFTHTHKQRKQTETMIFVTVGLVNPRTILKNDGLPEDTALTQKHLDAKESARKLTSARTNAVNGFKASVSAKTP